MTEQSNNIIIYQTPSGKTQIDVQLQNNTIWLTQKAIKYPIEVNPPAKSINIIPQP